MFRKYHAFMKSPLKLAFGSRMFLFSFDASIYREEMLKQHEVALIEETRRKLKEEEEREVWNQQKIFCELFQSRM